MHNIDLHSVHPNAHGRFGMYARGITRHFDIVGRIIPIARLVAATATAAAAAGAGAAGAAAWRRRCRRSRRTHVAVILGVELVVVVIVGHRYCENTFWR